MNDLQNIFDNLDALAPPTQADLCDKLDRYLSMDVEVTDNVILWWVKRRAMFPRLSRMALDYLMISGMFSLFFIQILSDGVASYVC